MSLGSGKRVRTEEAKRSLVRMGEELGFYVQLEYPYYPALGQSGCRADVAWLVSEGRPLVLFEVDAEHEQAEHNYVKILASPHAFHAVPGSIIHVRHGDASKSRTLDPIGKLVGRLRLPPRFITILNLTPDSEKCAIDLHKQITHILATLSFEHADVDADVFDVCNAYHELLCDGHIGRALSVLSARVHLYLHLSKQGTLPVKHSAIHAVALQKLLQQVGYAQASLGWYRKARALDLTRISASAQAIAEASRLKALASMSTGARRRRLLELGVGQGGMEADVTGWRLAGEEASLGREEVARRLVSEYLEMGGGPIGNREANAHLALGKGAMARGRLESALGHAQGYLENEMAMWVKDGRMPIGSLNGVLTGFFFEASVHKRLGRGDAVELLDKLDRVQTRAGIGDCADGIAELKGVTSSLGDRDGLPAQVDLVGDDGHSLADDINRLQQMLMTLRG